MNRTCSTIEHPLHETVAVNESPEMLSMMEEAYDDLDTFCRMYLQDNFYEKPSPLHVEMFDKINVVKKKKKLVIQAPRGIGKTTTARAICAQAICFAKAKFIVYISNSATSAEMQTENLKKDLMSPEIKRDFGNIKARKVGGDVDDSWSKKTWVASTAGGEHYTLVLPRGSGQQIRGQLWKDPLGRNVRPDLIVIDDLEDSDTIDNRDQRVKRKIWFFADVMKCFNRLNPNWSVIYIDTIKHFAALIVELLEASDWDHVNLSICDQNYKSLAPAFMSDDEIEEEVKSHREKGIMDVFAREYMGMAISREDATFRSDLFRYFRDEGDKLIRLGTGKNGDKFEPVIVKDTVTVVLVDPAKTAKRHSAETGFVVWTIDLVGNNIFLRFASGEKLHQDEIENRAIELCLQFGAFVLGIEVTGSKEFITYPLNNEIIRRRLNIEIVELNARKGQGEFAGVGGGKRMRISSLVGFYRRGQVWHNEIGIGAYETQLLEFPKSKRWDIMDAAAYITEMLDVGGRFFFPKDMVDESAESVEKEYADLMSDDYEPINYGVCP